MKTLFFIFIFCLLTSFLNATIINVPADQPTIQAGITAAANTDTILVQPGTYVENINYNGKLITVGSLFLTTQDTSYISSTIIDGNGSGSVVSFLSGEDSTVVLCGFTITDGSADWGGGICCSGSNPILHDMIVSGNAADYGGGIYYSGNSDLRNVTISNNSAVYSGGGIYCFSSNSTLENVTVTGNSAYWGGGIYFYSCNPNLQDVTISNNYGYMGSGICCWDNSCPSLKNVIVSGNYGDGNTIFCYNNSNPIFENNTISGNSSGGSLKYCIVCYINCSPVLINTILWNESMTEIYFDHIHYPDDPNSITISYSDIRGGESGIFNNNGTVNWMEGNIDSDPLFVNPSIGNYHLQPISPCIDAGDPASPLDPDGSIVDMGAYFFQYLPPNADFIVDTTNGDVPITVNFTDLSTHGSLAIDEWYWDFGDGNNSSLQHPVNEYQLPGIYTVSLTVTDVNDSTDTETKTDYITVYSSDPPAPPTNVQVNIVYPDAVISWTAVDTTLSGDPCITEGYIVLYNETAYEDEQYYYFLDYTTELNYTHTFVAQHREQMFYKVVSYIDLSREQMKFLLNLNKSNNKMKWNDVKQNLKIRNSLK